MTLYVKTCKLPAALAEHLLGFGVKSYSGGIRHDYKQQSAAERRARPTRWRLSWFLLGLVPPLALAVALVTQNPEPPPEPTLIETDPHLVPLLEALPDEPLALALPEPEAQQETEPALLVGADRLKLEIGRGDSLDILFRRNGLNRTDLANLARLPLAKPHLTLLKPGQSFDIAHRDGNILSISKEVDEMNVLVIERTDDEFTAEMAAREVEFRQASAHATIKSSLFEAGKAAGISDSLIMNMAGIFQWDIDFIQDVRIGDEFSVIYEELWRDGVRLRTGEIVAAEFINRGNTYRAVRYTDGGGRTDYYTPEGRSVRKAFVRAPVDFTRISSRFNPRRRHPILNTIRAHRGVDYAAPKGTPVKAAGDGKVSFRGRKGGYGNTVILQHGGNITTLYAHLSGFARKARRGTRVKQGQVIGYVGSTGLATAAHLHYEYRVSGVHRNPRTVKLPPASPVGAEYRDDFMTTTEPVWRQLDLYRRTRLASASIDTEPSSDKEET